MRDEINPEGTAPVPTPMDRRLHAIDPPPIPEDLLDRCLATVPQANRPVVPARRRLDGWRTPAAIAAAAILVIGPVVMLARPRAADAAGLLRAVRAAGIKVDASHTVMIIRGHDGTRREETWYVRGRGRRQEIRIDDKPTAYVIRNQRWEFRWDIPGRLVAAWSTELNAGHRGPDDSGGTVLNGDEMVRWAESQRADQIEVETATVAGRKLRRMTLKWPGPPSGGFLPRGETIWFDPDSLVPVKQIVEYDDGRSIETRTDYPAPASVPDDLFAFRPPAEVTIEINDPDLGRQVYSDPRTPDRPGDNP
jgi:hypothetical protein